MGGQIRTDMQVMGKKNVKELVAMADKTQQVGQKWHAQLLQRERSILHKVFDKYERRGTKLGMTQEDFKEFGQALPDGYWDRFQRMGTFHRLAHHSETTSLIDFDDFRFALDLFAEMETDD